VTAAAPRKGMMNYTTSIGASSTASEMQTMLARHGASRVMLEYGDRGIPSGLSFTLPTPHGERSFTLPCDIDAMHKVLIEQNRQGLLRSGNKTVRASREQAERVAWRVLKDWLSAQLALIETQMVDMTEIMLPYLRQVDGRTLYEAYREHEALALPGGDS
jgi:hypothetical protein